MAEQAVRLTRVKRAVKAAGRGIRAAWLWLFSDVRDDIARDVREGEGELCISR